MFLNSNTSLSMDLFCNSRIHVITLYSGHVCVYYASMLWGWHLVWILVRTDNPCLRVGCHRARTPGPVGIGPSPGTWSTACLWPSSCQSLHPVATRVLRWTRLPSLGRPGQCSLGLVLRVLLSHATNSGPRPHYR
jgi:hypothetical protein